MQNIPSETKTFFPSARRALRSAMIVGFLAVAGMAILLWVKGEFKDHREITIIISVCMFPLGVALMYLRFLIGRTGKIEISPKGITNTTRSGKAYSILWNEVTSAKHGTIGHQETFTIKASTKHRIHFTEEGLAADEWREICKLVEHYTADKR